MRLLNVGSIFQEWDLCEEWDFREMDPIATNVSRRNNRSDLKDTHMMICQLLKELHRWPQPKQRGELNATPGSVVGESS